MFCIPAQSTSVFLVKRKGGETALGTDSSCIFFPGLLLGAFGKGKLNPQLLQHAPRF